MMNRLIPWLVLVEVIALVTAIVGWWTVPILAAVYALIYPDRKHWLSTALAGLCGWGLLIDITWFQGPVFELAGKVGGALGLPGAAFVLLTLIFPALLAGSAAELAAAVRRAVADMARPERARAR
jgi:hypothetical protein